ncbi:hypothetical protein FO519_006145 [Halicephalobus sp. NKZ332]|nr:hypothetical protein FO519_006145 [Halicephalobus sp. NKZ332]
MASMKTMKRLLVDACLKSLTLFPTGKDAKLRKKKECAKNFMQSQIITIADEELSGVLNKHLSPQTTAFRIYSAKPCENFVERINPLDEVWLQKSITVEAAIHAEAPPRKSHLCPSGVVFTSLASESFFNEQALKFPQQTTNVKKFCQIQSMEVTKGQEKSRKDL